MQRHAALRQPALAASSARETRAAAKASSVSTSLSIRVGRSRLDHLHRPGRVALPLIPSAYAAGRSYDEGNKLLQDWGGGGDEGGGGSDDDDDDGGRGGGGGGKDPGAGGGGGSEPLPRSLLLALAALLLASAVAAVVWRVRSSGKEEQKEKGKRGGSGSSGGSPLASLTSSTLATGVLSSSSAPPSSPPAIPPFSAADDADVQALRRLMREALETLQGHGERLDALDDPDGENNGGASTAPFSSSSAGGGRLSRGARQLREAEAASRFAPLGAMRRRAGGSSARRAAAAPLLSSAAEGAPTLEGEVVVDASSSSSFSSSSASTRARVRACLHGPARGGRDSWLAQLDSFGGAGGGGGESSNWNSNSTSANLSKLLYSLSLGRRARLLLAPLGCRGCDVAPTLNPVAGAGLTHAAREGSSPHLRLGCGGCGGGGGEGENGGGGAAAVGWRHRWRGGAGVSAAAFHHHQPAPAASPLSPSSNNKPGKTSTLIQLDGPLTDAVSAGVVAVLERPHGGRGARRGTRRGRAPPSPSDAWERADSPSSSSSLSSSSSSSSFGDDSEDDDFAYRGTGRANFSASSSSGTAAAATLGAMAAAALGESGEVTASAWACARVEGRAASRRRQPSNTVPSATDNADAAAASSSPISSFPSASRGWGASLASRPSGGSGSGRNGSRKQPGWILAVAGESPPAERRRKGKRSSVTAEASLVLPLESSELGGGGGSSVTLVPGVVFTRRGGENAVSLACRSVLAF